MGQNLVFLMVCGLSAVFPIYIAVIALGDRRELKHEKGETQNREPRLVTHRKAA